MNERLYRSVDDRVIAGVCGGLADRLAVDPSLVRVVWAVVALMTGIFPLLVIYVIMAAVVPEDPKGFAGAWPSPTPPATPREPEAPGPTGAPGEPEAPIPAHAAADPVAATSAGAPVPPPGLRRTPGTRARRRRAGRVSSGSAIPSSASSGASSSSRSGSTSSSATRSTIDWGVVGAAGLVAAGAVVIVAALRPRR